MIPFRALPALLASALVTAAAPLPMTPVQPELFAATGALVNAFGDPDSDGDADLFVGFGGTANRFYRNDRGRFVEVGATVGLAAARATRAAAWGDFDGDADPDLLVGFAPGDGGVLTLYRNDRGTFVDATAEAGLTVAAGAVRQPVWVDTDGDEDLDLFVAFRDRANMLFRNDGAHFTDIAAEVGLADVRKSVGAAWADLDADGDLDLLVGNMDGDANGAFRNDDGRFTDVAESWGLAWGGRTPRDPANGTVRPCIADVNGDGLLDAVFANYGKPGLFLGRVGGGFTDVSEAWGIAVDGRYDTCALADVDNDGKLDLYLNGTVTQGKNWPDYLYRQENGRFVDAIPAAVAAVPADHGAAWADVNGDGAVELALTGQGAHALFTPTLHPSIARRSVRVRVVDGAFHATRAGAEVRVYAEGTDALLGVRVIDAGSGYDAQSDLPVHLGLGGSGKVDIEVIWPARGARTRWRKNGVKLDGRKVVEVWTGTP